jgi:hypothetical protein
VSEFDGLLPPAPGEVVSDGLPADVEAVWGVSDRSRETAVFLVGAWGLAAFRSSVVHQLAVAERGRVPKAGMLGRSLLRPDPKVKKQ